MCIRDRNCSIEWLEINPMHLTAKQNLQDTNFPLIAARTNEKMRVLRPWGNLLVEKELNHK